MKNLNSLTLKELENYIGITDNENYMYKAKIIADFRLLADLCEGQNVDIILKEDFYNLGLHKTKKIFYEYNNLIAYVKE